ncbi:cytochrome P450 4c3-like, partial [Hyalella azteca]|uniref:Cytochrome P450 4c3-like n=1 Tax=Hyalella azteca TaxID=294128 RepID=A0A979FVM2_HYAAZ
KLQYNVGDKPFNVYPSVTLFTLDVIMETAMGNDINVQNDEESDYVKAVVGIAELIQTRQFSPWLHSDLIFKLSGLEKKQRRYIDTLHAMSLGAIRTRRIEYNKIKKQGAGNSAQEPQIIGAKKRLAFLDLLLEASESSDARLTDEDLREEVDTFMFEGHDTTAAALSFTIYLLGRHPQIQARVVQELNDVLGEGDVTITTDALRDLKLLEACIKEALRIFPSVPFVGRKLLKPATLNGYELPAGTNVIAMIYCIHRDPEQFPNPEEFNPDRFLGDEVTKRHPYSYVPFSAGPRNCIGQKFALMEEKVMMAHFLRTYEVTAKQSFQELGLLGELILRPDHGVMVTLQRRK